MKLPEKTLATMKEFVKDETGTGIADYGIVLALSMIAAGFVAGYLFFPSQPTSGVVNSGGINGTPIPGTAAGPPRVCPGKGKPLKYSCEACGMG